MKKILAILGCAALAAGTAFGQAEAEFEDISITELKEKIEAKEVILLDVNGSKSFERGHIPGAVDFRSTKKEDLAEALGEDKDVLVVAYCGGPKCSAYKAGAKAAQKMGFTNVKHLSAGISGWLKAGEKTEKPDDKG